MKFFILAILSAFGLSACTHAYNGCYFFYPKHSELPIQDLPRATDPKQWVFLEEVDLKDFEGGRRLRAMTAYFWSGSPARMFGKSRFQIVSGELDWDADWQGPRSFSISLHEKAELKRAWKLRFRVTPGTEARLIEAGGEWVKVPPVARN